MATKKGKPDPAAKLVRYMEQAGKSAHEPVTFADFVAATRAVAEPDGDE
jgi:hypothetical protein